MNTNAHYAITQEFISLISSEYLQCLVSQSFRAAQESSPSVVCKKRPESRLGMSDFSKIPIIQCAYQLTLDLHRLVQLLPRQTRFVAGQEILARVSELAREKRVNIWRAWRTDDGSCAWFCRPVPKYHFKKPQIKVVRQMLFYDRLKDI